MRKYRPIKFRAWDTINKVMMKPVQIGFNDDNSDNPVLAISFDGSKISGHNNYILLQYTGLKDVNGEEIYEGDLIENYGYDHEEMEVFWCDEETGFTPFNCEDYEGVCRVVGNIFENKRKGIPTLDELVGIIEEKRNKEKWCR